MVDTPADRATSAIVTTEAFFIQASLEVFGFLYTFAVQEAMLVRRSRTAA
ncbi:hypothetical protein GCM10009745_81280 [Kribbella yunnanensis]|uniref:Uncharacterized protein n=1 Tax=Kribbella yunnanensis TaxID=190194 RepID=A0ABN2J887_9ACTN